MQNLDCKILFFFFINKKNNLFKKNITYTKKFFSGNTFFDYSILSYNLLLFLRSFCRVLVLNLPLLKSALYYLGKVLYYFTNVLYKSFSLIELRKVLIKKFFCSFGKRSYGWPRYNVPEARNKI